MNYGQVRKYDIANGQGIRTSLFVTGCVHNCKNCFNQEYMNPLAGKPFTKEVEKIIIDNLHDPNVTGLTILGGEPFQNTDGLIPFVKRVRRESEKSVWIYSGYTWEEIHRSEARKELLYLCDILVDGRFVQELKDLTLRFRGSSNQRVIDIQESKKQNKIVLLLK